MTIQSTLFPAKRTDDQTITQGRDVYDSNCFISESPSFLDFSLFHVQLVPFTAGETFLSRVGSIFPDGPICRVGDNAYSPSPDALTQLGELSKGQPSSIRISNTAPDGARIVGSLIYDLIDIDMKISRGVTSARSWKEGKRLYYRPEDSLFVKSVDDRPRSARYVALRGVRPKAYASSVAGRVLLFLVPDAIYQIQIDDYSEWIGKRVRFSRQMPIDVSKSLVIHKVTGHNVTVRDTVSGRLIDCDAGGIKVNAEAHILSEVGVYQDFLSFSQFRDTGENKFLETAFGSIYGDAHHEVVLKSPHWEMRLRRLKHRIGALP